MTHHARWRSIWAGLILSAAFAWTPASLAAEKLIWLLRDLPPLTVFDGPQKNQGVVDQLLATLIASMPQYQHVTIRVNRARGMRMLEDSSLTCDPTLLWNPARAQRIVYSRPILGVRSNGLVIRRQDQLLIAPYIQNEKVDLQAMLNAHALKLGIIAKRSYGAWIDEPVLQSSANQLFIHYGNDPLVSLLHMQHAGRLQAIVGYWPEIQAKARQQGLRPETLIFYPILDAPAYQALYIGCSGTPEGRNIIRIINTLLPPQKPGTLSKPTAPEGSRFDQAFYSQLALSASA